MSKCEYPYCTKEVTHSIAYDEEDYGFYCQEHYDQITKEIEE